MPSVADIEAPTPAPKFITRGHLYKAIIGDTIVLPCKVKDLGELHERSSYRLLTLPFIGNKFSISSQWICSVSVNFLFFEKTRKKREHVNPIRGVARKSL
jgi:hypothetical protein